MAPSDIAALAAALDAALPQTQCTRCGYPDCIAYAQAMAAGEAAINQCPPGGAEGVARLARISGQPVLALNPLNGVESVRQLAVIDEAWCIGCTLCIKACPVDCIIGASKRMHTVIGAQCTGCELCVPACPVDCIAMIDVSSPRTGWAAWSAAQAAQARTRHAARARRLERERRESDARLGEATPNGHGTPKAGPAGTSAQAASSAQAMVEAAFARARQARERAR